MSYAKRPVLWIVLLLLAAFVLTACTPTESAPASSQASSASSAPASSGEVTDAPLEEITVVLDWTPNTNHTGLYVALEKGWYEEAGLDVRLVQPPENGALPLVAAGKAQFAISFQEEIATALNSSNPLPVTAVASIIDHNLSGLISLTSTGIESPKDLEGKRYASWETPLEKAIIDNLISSDGGDPSQLVYVPNTVTDIFSALNTDIDVIWIFEAWDGMAAKVGGMEFNYMDFRELNPVFDFYTPVIASSDTFLAEQPELAKAFLAATRRGYEFAIAEPDAAADILLNHAPELDEAIVKASQSFLADQYQAEKDAWGTIDPERWSAFYQWLYDEGITAENLGLRGFSNDYLP